jgi:uncharacterized protein
MKAQKMSFLGGQQKLGMSARDAGQKGGDAVKKKYGPEFYKRIGRKGGEATKAVYGREFYESIGKKGGEQKSAARKRATAMVPPFYEEIGRRGGPKVKALIERAKKAAATHDAEKKTS